MATLNQELGAHKVTVRTVRLVKEDDGSVTIGVKVEFKDGEYGFKYLNNRNEKSLQFMRKGLKAIGFNVDKYPVSQLAGNDEALDGVECEAVVGEWQGKKRIDWLNPIKASPATEDLDALTDALRAVKGNDEKGGDE